MLFNNIINIYPAKKSFNKQIRIVNINPNYTHIFFFSSRMKLIFFLVIILKELAVNCVKSTGILKVVNLERELFPVIANIMNMLRWIFSNIYALRLNVYQPINR